MKNLVFLFCIILFNNLKSQEAPDLSNYKTSEQKLQAWASYCDLFLSKEDFTKLRIAAFKGLNITPTTDNYNLSLFNFYIGITFNYTTESDSASFYLERSETFARKIKHTRRTTEALKQLLNIYTNYTSNTYTQRVVNELLACIDTAKNLKQKADLFGNISSYYTNKGQYETSLKYLLDELKARESYLSKAGSNDSINYGVNLINVAELYLKLGNGVKGISYIREGEPFLRTYKAGIAKTNKMYVDAYLNLNRPAEATIYYKKLMLFLQTADCEICWQDLLAIDLTFSDYYTTKLKNKSALIYINHAKSLAPKYADEYMMANINYISGQIYLQGKDYKKALNYFKAAEPVIKDISMEQNSWIQKALAEVYGALGKWDSAYSYQSRYTQIQDTLLIEKAKKNLAEAEQIYQNEKKQLSIISLSKENKIKNLQLINVNKQRWFFIIGFILTFAIGILLLYQNRQRKKNNTQLKKLNTELEKANQIKARFFSILNHDLRAPVSSLIHFLHLQKNSPELLDAESKVRLEDKTISATENLLISMEDMLIWSKGQMDEFKPRYVSVNVNGLFKDIENHFLSTENVIILFENTEDIELFTDIDYLKTIMRNLTSNAIKALSKTTDAKIIWKAWQNKDQTYLSITDNGSGGNQDQFKALYDDTEVVGIKTGLGLHLIRDLAKAINCTIKVTTKINSGTIIEISINAKA